MRERDVAHFRGRQGLVANGERAPQGYLPDDTIMAVHDYAAADASFTCDPDVEDGSVDVFMMSDNNLALPDYQRIGDRLPVQAGQRGRVVSDAYYPADQVATRPDAPNLSNPGLDSVFTEDLLNARAYRTRYELTNLPHAAELVAIDTQRARLDADLGEDRQFLVNSFDLDREGPIFTSSPSLRTRVPPPKPLRKKKLAAEAAKRAAESRERCKQVFAFNAPKPRRDIDGEKISEEFLKINRSLDDRVDDERTAVKKGDVAPQFDPVLGVRPPMKNAPTSRPITPRFRRRRGELTPEAERTLDSVRSGRSGRKNASGNKLAVDFGADDRKRAGSVENLAGGAGPSKVARVGRTVFNGAELKIMGQNNRFYVKGDSWDETAPVFMGHRYTREAGVSLIPSCGKLTTDGRLYEKFRIPGNP